MIFESHAHYDDERFNIDRIAVLKKVRDSGVGAVVNIGVTMDSSRKSIEMCKSFPFLYTTIGVHPHDVKEMKEDDLEKLILMSAFPKVVGIGEIGLDYHYDYSPRATQKLWFRQQLELAKNLGLPVSIHSREATQDTYDILMESGIANEKGGVIHAFSGSVDIAKQYVKAGFYLGIGGVLTFKNGKKLVEVVKAIPLEHLLLETDSPYLTPVPYRGKRNDSSNLPLVRDKIAEIKGVSADKVEQLTWQNGCHLFGINA